jgi:phosphonate transport system permease protein
MNEIIVKRNGRYQLSKLDSSKILIRAFFFTIAIISVLFMVFVVEYKWELFNGSAFIYFMTQFFRFDLIPSDEIIEAFTLLINTIALGFLTTIIGVFIGLFLGLFASINITNGKIAAVIKAIASFVRAVPTIIWVLFFVSGLGLTSTTAIIGMSFHSIAFFIKAFSEAFEEVDPATIETLKATGANKAQIISSAILPSSFTKLLAWIAIRTELNFGVAVIIGPAVGVAGTIGSRINTYSRGANYPGLGLTVVSVFIVVFIFEFIVNRIKQKEIL